MNLHQYRVLKAMAAKPETTEEERKAIEGTVDDFSHCDHCCICGKWDFGFWFSDSEMETKVICRECADKGE